MHMMYKILHPHRQNLIVNLDDILIFSKMLAEHKTHMEGVLQELRNVRLRLGVLHLGKITGRYLSLERYVPRKEDERR